MKAAIRAAYLNALHFFLGFLSTYKYIFFRNSNLWKKWTETPPPNNWWKLIFGMLKGKSRSLDPRVGKTAEITFERKCRQWKIMKIYVKSMVFVVNQFNEKWWRKQNFRLKCRSQQHTHIHGKSAREISCQRSKPKRNGLISIDFYFFYFVF